MELKTAHDGIDCNVPVRLQYSRMHILKFRHRTSKMLFWYDSVVCNICMIVCMCITRGRVHWTWGLLYWSITIIRTCLYSVPLDSWRQYITYYRSNNQHMDVFIWMQRADRMHLCSSSRPRASAIHEKDKKTKALHTGFVSNTKDRG